MRLLLTRPDLTDVSNFGLSIDPLRAILVEAHLVNEEIAMHLLQLCLLTALLGISQLGRAASQDSITLIGNEGCFDGDGASKQIETALEHGRRDEQPSPKVSLAVSKALTSLNVSLRVINHKGGLMLSRSYTLSPGDCPEIPNLITLVLEEALRTLPLETWRQEPIHSGTERRSTANRVFFMAASEATTFSPAIAVGTHLFFWDNGTFKAFGSLQAGFGPWFDLVQGSAQEATLLLGFGVSVESSKLFGSGQLLGGGAHYRGLSTPNARSSTLPYIEAAGELGTFLGQSALTLRLSLPVLRHGLQVEGDMNVRTLESLRLGLGLSLPL